MTDQPSMFCNNHQRAVNLLSEGFWTEGGSQRTWREHTNKGLDQEPSCCEATALTAGSSYMASYIFQDRAESKVNIESK